jgi:hypothetical protein
MRHLVVCDIDVSPIAYNRFSDVLMSEKENDPSYQIVSKYCPNALNMLRMERRGYDDEQQQY